MCLGSIMGWWWADWIFGGVGWVISLCVQAYFLFFFGFQEKGEKKRYGFSVLRRGVFC